MRYLCYHRGLGATTAGVFKYVAAWQRCSTDSPENLCGAAAPLIRFLRITAVRQRRIFSRDGHLWKLPTDIVHILFCRTQKIIVNYTISSHGMFAKEKIIGSFGRSKSDIFPFFKNLLSHSTRNNRRNFTFFLFKTSIKR